MSRSTPSRRARHVLEPRPAVQAAVCCSVSEVQLLLCGANSIDVADWKANTSTNLRRTRSSQVQWFWALVGEMTPEEQSKLLLFCTGSMRPPATGFGSLMGFNGSEHRFTVKEMPPSDRLPTAHACFNMLDLPQYSSEAKLRTKVRLALTEAQGFDERAVAQ